MTRPLLLTAALLTSGCGALNPSPVTADEGKGPGGAAARARNEDYIRGDRFAKLVLEVDSVAGFEPREASANAIVSQLQALLAKGGGITVAKQSGLPSKGADHAWTFEELDALAKETFDAAVPADTIKMHALFLDGHSADDTSGGKVLGLAWAQTHLVIFKKTIEDGCRAGLTGLLAEKVCEDAEKGVWLHEVGHLLGLVNNGLPMVTPHADADHPAHDASEGCVMFWAYETGGLLDELRTRVTGGNSSPLEFDAQCKADLAAVRDR